MTRILSDVPLDEAALRRLEAMPGVSLCLALPHEKEWDLPAGLPRDADILVCKWPPRPLDALTNLKVMQISSVGYEHLKHLKLWERPLGDGFSSILCDGDVLYTMYSARDKEDPYKGDEVVVALDAGTGINTSRLSATPDTAATGTVTLNFGLAMRFFSGSLASVNSSGTGCVAGALSFYEYFTGFNSFDLSNRSIQLVPTGGGYTVHFLPADPAIADADLAVAAAALNRGLEACVRVAPAQYQWTYKRFSFRGDGDTGPDPVYGKWRRSRKKRAERGPEQQG